MRLEREREINFIFKLKLKLYRENVRFFFCSSLIHIVEILKVRLGHQCLLDLEGGVAEGSGP